MDKEMQAKASSAPDLNRLPQLVIYSIVDYLDTDALLACTELLPRWNALTEDAKRWEELCRSLGIPKCRYFEHPSLINRWEEWSIDCGIAEHSWKRAILREKAIENKWRNGEVDVKALPQFEEDETADNPILTYGEWAIFTQLFEITIVDLNEPLPRCLASITEEEYTFSKVLVIPVGNQPPLLVAGTEEGAILIYELDGREFPLTHILNDHEYPISCLAASTRSSRPQTPDERCLFISSSVDGTIRLWNAVTGECLRLFPERGRPFYGANFFDETILFVDFSGNVHCGQINGDRMSEIRACGPHSSRVESDGKWLFCIYRDYAEISNLRDPFKEYSVRNMTLRDGECIKFLPDFKTEEVIFNFGRNVYVYELKTGKCVVFQKAEDEATSLLEDIYLTDKFVFSVSEDKKIHIWDRKARKYIRQLCEIAEIRNRRTRLALTDSAQHLVCAAGKSFPVSNRFILQSVHIISIHSSN